MRLLSYQPVPRTSHSTFGSPSAYTWAARPRYKMAGCQMCSGENSVPTWPFHCFDKSILTIDRSPELTAVSPRPSVKNTPDGSISESRAPTTPVALRPVSASHAPAVVSAPGAQFRKDCWHPQKPSSGRWLRRGQRFFRNWAPGSKGNPGNWYADNVRAHAHTFGQRLASGGGANYGSPTSQLWLERTGDAAKTASYGGEETVPQHIWHPLCLYLGRPA